MSHGFLEGVSLRADQHGDSGSALLAPLQLRQASALLQARLLADRWGCDKAGQPERTDTDTLTDGSLSAPTAELDKPVNKSVTHPCVRARIRVFLNVGDVDVAVRLNHACKG